MFTGKLDLKGSPKNGTIGVSKYGSNMDQNHKRNIKISFLVNMLHEILHIYLQNQFGMVTNNIGVKGTLKMTQTWPTTINKAIYTTPVA